MTLYPDSVREEFSKRSSTHEFTKFRFVFIRTQNTLNNRFKIFYSVLQYTFFTVPAPRNKSGHTSESCRDGDCTSCWPKTKYIGMKSMTGACSEMPGLHPGDAWCKRYPGYKNGKSTAFIRSVSFERFWAPGRHRSFDSDSQYMLKLPRFFSITFNSAIYLIFIIIYWKTVLFARYTENHNKT